MIESILFYLFSGGTLLGALYVILTPKPTRALLSLIATMFSLAVLYLLLGAPFVAMVHLIVYAGAVLVLFLFVIMLQGIGATDIPLKDRFHKGYLFCATFVGVCFLILTVFLASQTVLHAAAGITLWPVEALGQTLFEEYLLPFELISVLLLIGVFAAVTLAKKEERE